MDRNINEKLRKPRRTRGTPLYKGRNYYALGAIAFGAVSLFLYESWSETAKLKQSIRDGKFKYSQEWRDHIATMQMSLTSREIQPLLRQLRERKEEADGFAPKPNWFTKLMDSKPDLGRGPGDL